MNNQKTPTNVRRRRTTAVTAAVAAGLTAAVLAIPPAEARTAPPAARSFTPAAAAATIRSLTARLGEDETGGAYYDKTTGALVVNVLNAQAADQVRRTGAQPRIVRYSMSTLHASEAALSRQARIAGTAWSVDPRTDQVVVSADRTVRGAHLARLQGAVAALGGTARLHSTAGTFRPLILGGDAIWGPGVRCSLGFNVSVGGQPYFLTAGHCGEAASSWSDSRGGYEVGQVVGATFPGHDYSLVRYDDPNSAHASAVDLYNGSTQRIDGATDATVGMQVERSGSTTGVYGGTVTGVDATVNYEEGSVYGLIDTDVCAEPGDSGGALFSGDRAVGLTSGGSGDCSRGGETFFQPVTDALNAYGATLP
ncbi:S1 family peptidase [Catenulispora subtropica]|uniref:S1 family peptidase n=1 Tax=Catenulispora subtropica TaxID=450798 RepID=A0ABP5CQT1_9ACTN